MLKFQSSLNFPLTLIVIIVACLVGFFAYHYKIPSPVIETPKGKIRGFEETSREGRTFYSYLGIPYAKPPVANLRFQPPQPADDWIGIRETTSFGSMCIQVDNLFWKITGDEDCLFLNVFRPNKINAGLVPVIVYIHGGYFMTGGSHFHQPHYFMDEDVVFVTFNYRLGILGFLSTQDGIIEGNMGLKDQNFALKWIRDNIELFGGDPKRVTLLGESAGAASVHFHMLSQMSKGLFHKAISQSGTAIKLWSMASKPREQSIRLGQRLRCPTSSSLLLRNCLQHKDVNELIATQAETITPLLDPLQMYGPTVETEALPTESSSKYNDNVFLSDHPYTLILQGRFHQVPWITGINSDEGLLLTARIAAEENLVSQLEDNWATVLPLYLVYPREDVNVTKKIADYYLPSLSGKKLVFYKSFKDLTTLMTDRLYLVATREAAIRHASKSRVFLYHNKYQGEQSLTLLFGMNPNIMPVTLQFVWKLFSRYILRKLGLSSPKYDIGVCHGDELFLIFKVPLMEVHVGSPDYEFSKSLINLWVQFAYNEKDMIFNGYKWNPIPSVLSTSTKLNYLTFESDLNHSIKHEEFTERAEFWKSLNLPWIL